MSEPARTELPPVDVRIGSTANALQPVSSAERSLAAGRAQWIVLLLVAGAAVFADQLTKQVVGRTLEARRERRHRRAVLDPPRPELGDRVRALRESDGDRDRGDRRRGRRDARVLRSVGPSSPRLCPLHSGSSSAGASRTSSTASDSGTSPTSSISSPGPRSTSRTRSSSWVSRSCSARSSSPIGHTACTERAVATLRFSVAESQVGSRLDRALAERPEVGTRSLAERLLRDGAVTVDGAHEGEEPSPRSRLGRRGRAARMPAGVSSRSPPPCASPTRTSISSSSTSPPGSPCTPGAGASDWDARRATAQSRRCRG